MIPESERGQGTHPQETEGEPKVLPLSHPLNENRVLTLIQGAAFGMPRITEESEGMISRRSGQQIRADEIQYWVGIRDSSQEIKPRFYSNNGIVVIVDSDGTVRVTLGSEKLYDVLKDMGYNHEHMYVPLSNGAMEQLGGSEVGKAKWRQLNMLDRLQRAGVDLDKVDITNLTQEAAKYGVKDVFEAYDRINPNPDDEQNTDTPPQNLGAE